jgi:hypothetical protein
MFKIKLPSSFKINLLFCLVLFFAATEASGQGGYEVSWQRHYVCYYAAEAPVIDGTGDEPVWQHVPWTEDYTDIEGDIRPKPAFRTRTKMLWDKENLYIYTELEEPDLWGTLHQHDTIIYDDNDFEVFIDPDNDTHDYFELEFNTLNTEMDLFLAKPYRNGGRALLSWDAQGVRSAVQTRGTLNHPGDSDKGWSIEMAIPLMSLSFWGDRLPQDGSQWRINFSRVEWDRDIKNGEYVVRTNQATGRRLPEHNWVWSPQGIIDMHAPERWGYLQFSAHTGGIGAGGGGGTAGGSDTVAFVQPADSKAREALWKVYYRQRDYRQKQGHYAASLKGLGYDDNSGLVITMEATSNQYMATVSGGAGQEQLSIDQDGKIGRSGRGQH